MPYRLKRSESVKNGIRRIAEETLQSADQNLRNDNADVAHAARRRLKMTRAVLRLVRPSLDDTDFDRENQALRDIGRTLSPLRDADVFITVLDTVGSLDADQRGFPLMAQIAKHDQQQVRRKLLDDGAISEARKNVRLARDRVADWATTDLRGSAIVKGLRKSYGRALEIGHTAARSRHDDRWHEWRKRVKDLWYHLRLVRAVWPAVTDGAIDALDRLDKSLGQDHDLAIVSVRLRSMGRERDVARELNQLRQLIRRRRGELQQQARDQSSMLFVARPGGFARQFEACWSAWRS